MLGNSNGCRYFLAAKKKVVSCDFTAEIRNTDFSQHLFVLSFAQRIYDSSSKKTSYTPQPQHNHRKNKHDNTTQEKPHDTGRSKGQKQTRKVDGRDGKTISTHTYTQPASSEKTISRKTRLDSPRHQMVRYGTPWKIYAVSSRLKQPARPTTAITTTTRTKPTTLGQTTQTTKAHDHEEGGADDENDDDNTILILSQRTDSWVSATLGAWLWRTHWYVTNPVMRCEILDAISAYLPCYVSSAAVCVCVSYFTC